MRLGVWPENPRAQDLRRFSEKPQHLRLRLVDSSPAPGPRLAVASPTLGFDVMTSFERSARTRLLARRDDLLNRYANQAIKLRVATAALRRAELLAAQTERGLTERELQDVDAALRRLVLRTYGKCERCGWALGKQRLLAEPETRLYWRCAPSEAAQKVATQETPPK
jgi:DnaK suppressor protein